LSTFDFEVAMVGWGDDTVQAGLDEVRNKPARQTEACDVRAEADGPKPGYTMSEENSREAEIDGQALSGQPGFAPANVVARPYAGIGLVCVLVAVFIFQITHQQFFTGQSPSYFELSPGDLMAQGGIIREQVDAGEWFRLLTGPMMHVSWIHLLMNSFAILVAAAVLERMVGRGWFLLVFFVTAWCAALGSYALNPSDLVSVGASGGGLGLFGAAIVLAVFRIERGETRNKVVMQVLQILIPSLLSVGTTATTRVDVAAHVAGALAGAVVGGVMLLLWRRDDQPIRGRGMASLVAVAAAVATGLALFFASQQLNAWSGDVEAFRFQAAWTGRVVPNERMGEIETNFDAVAEEFPDDPRVRLRFAGQALDDGRLDETLTILEPIANRDQELNAVFPDGSISLVVRLLRASALERLRRYDEADTEAGTLCDDANLAPQQYMLVESICASRLLGVRVAPRIDAETMTVNRAAFQNNYPEDPRTVILNALEVMDTGQMDAGFHMLDTYWPDVAIYDQRLPDAAHMLRLGRSYGELSRGNRAAAIEAVGQLCQPPSRTSSEFVSAHCAALEAAP
jgi:membrane associated rhomboid family serine protease